MQDLKIRIRAQNRTPGGVDDEGEHLVGLVRRALDAGGASPVAVVIRAQRTELLELRAIAEARLRMGPFLAGLTRSEPEDAGPALAVGVAGRFQLRRGTGSVPVALVFLEWPDCRWWQWQALLDADNRPLPDGELRRRAEDGDALPGGLGRWWSHGRRTGAQVRYGSPLQRVSAQPSSPLVH